MSGRQSYNSDDWQSIHREVVRRVSRSIGVRKESRASKAIEELEQQFNDPREPEAQAAYLLKLAQAYFKADQYDKAEQLLSGVIGTYTYHVDLRLMHAKCALELGDMESAQQRYDALRQHFLDGFPPGSVRMEVMRDCLAFSTERLHHSALENNIKELRKAQQDQPITYAIQAGYILASPDGKPCAHGLFRDVLEGLLEKCPPSGFALAIASDVLAHVGSEENQTPECNALFNEFKPRFEERVRALTQQFGLPAAKPMHLELPESIDAISCRRRMLGYVKLMQAPVVTQTMNMANYMADLGKRMHAQRPDEWVPGYGGTMLQGALGNGPRGK